MEKYNVIELSGDQVINFSVGKEKKVLETVEDHYKELKEIAVEKGFEIFGLFLQGSQNYDVATETSDVDTKAIVIPNLRNLLKHEPISVVHVRENNEHIEYKDIMTMVSMFLKENSSYLELLFSKYILINSKFWNEWQKILEYREEIPYIDSLRGIYAIAGTMRNKLLALKHNYPTKVETINEFGYDPKQLHHIVRLEEVFNRYVDRYPYSKILQPSNPEYLISLKKGILSEEEATTLAEKTLDTVDKKLEEVKLFIRKNDTEKSKEIKNMLDDITYSSAYKVIKEE